MLFTIRVVGGERCWLASCLPPWVGFVVFVRHYPGGNYQQLLQVVFGSRAGKAVDVAYRFSFAGICVMFSASGAVLKNICIYPRL